MTIWKQFITSREKCPRLRLGPDMWFTSSRPCEHALGSLQTTIHKKSLSLWASYLEIAVILCTMWKQGSGWTRNNSHVLAMAHSNCSQTPFPASASITPFSSVFLSHVGFIIASLRSLFRYCFSQILPHKILISQMYHIYRYSYMYIYVLYTRGLRFFSPSPKPVSTPLWLINAVADARLPTST